MKNETKEELRLREKIKTYIISFFRKPSEKEVQGELKRRIDERNYWIIFIPLAIIIAVLMHFSWSSFIVFGVLCLMIINLVHFIVVV